MIGPLALDKTIHALFEEVVSKHPHRTAVVYKDKQLTYKELDERSNAAASHLSACGLKANSVVGLIIERSVDMIVGMIGILKAGAAYLPLDVHWPYERMKNVLESSATSVILYKGTVPEMRLSKAELVYLDLDVIDSCHIQKRLPMVNPDNTAYVLYTSGTTGTPKGVMIEHQSVINLVNGLFENVYRLEPDKLNVALLAPIVFDASVKQIFPSLLLGHTLFIVPDSLKLSASKLLKFFEKNDIDITDITPTYLSLLNLLPKNDQNLRIKLFLVGGELLHWKTYNEFHNKYGQYSRVLNVYGPTECCDVTTVHPVTDPSRYPDNYLTIPIGRPLENTYVYLLDKDGEVANEGEMFIGGLGVGKGYINNHHLTQNHFIENPFRKGEKMYRTGDVAKRLIDGSLLFLGRMDNQVKINGHRIEPKEIEHLLNSHDQIQQVIVIEVDGEGSGKKLCAFYAAQDEIPVEELRYFLSVQLPHYMIPSYFVRLKRFPVNSNGKVDRKTLAEYRFMGINS